MSKAPIVLFPFVLAWAAAHLQPAFAMDTGHRGKALSSRTAAEQEPEQPPRDPGALTVLAEIALERGDCKVASENYP